MRRLAFLLLVPVTLLVFTVAQESLAGEKILLWPNGAPGAKGAQETDQPSLTVYLAPSEKATGAAIVICPGGGYQHLAVNHEGEEIASWLNSLGVSAFVLRYRISPYQHPAPLQDAQRAIRTVRTRAGEWGINPARVGALGFSAGGHLTSTLATHFDDGDAAATDPIDKTSCRPDFAVLCYPVISLQSEAIAHKGSRKNLLGDNPAPELVEQLSNDTQVTKNTPPVFIWHTGEDRGVRPEHSVNFYLACLKAGVPAELHIYEKGPHGIGLGKKYPLASQWPTQCEAWLRDRGLLTK